MEYKYISKRKKSAQIADSRLDGFDDQGLARPEFKFVKNRDFGECSEWNLCFGCYGPSQGYKKERYEF